MVKLGRRWRERSEATARGAGSEREWEGGHGRVSRVYVAAARLWLAGGPEGERGCAAGRWTWPRRRPLAAGGGRRGARGVAGLRVRGAMIQSGRRISELNPGLRRVAARGLGKAAARCQRRVVGQSAGCATGQGGGVTEEL